MDVTSIHPPPPCMRTHGNILFRLIREAYGPTASRDHLLLEASNGFSSLLYEDPMGPEWLRCRNCESIWGLILGCAMDASHLDLRVSPYMHIWPCILGCAMDGC